MKQRQKTYDALTERPRDASGERSYVFSLFTERQRANSSRYNAFFCSTEYVIASLELPLG